jgi:hypothetical protein
MRLPRVRITVERTVVALSLVLPVALAVGVIGVTSAVPAEAAAKDFAWAYASVVGL